MSLDDISGDSPAHRTYQKICAPCPQLSEECFIGSVQQANAMSGFPFNQRKYSLRHQRPSRKRHNADHRLPLLRPLGGHDLCACLLDFGAGEQNQTDKSFGLAHAAHTVTRCFEQRRTERTLEFPSSMVNGCPRQPAGARRAAKSVV